MASTRPIRSGRKPRAPRASEQAVIGLLPAVRAGGLRRVKHVALIVEATQAPRRQMLSGVAQYIQEHEPWAVYIKPPRVERSIGDWLKQWDGDGIIAAIQPQDVEMLRGRGLPTVDVAGAVSTPGVPLVHANDVSIGRLGAEHLIERGFRHFAFCDYGTFWSVPRRDGFVGAARARGFDVRVYSLKHHAELPAGPISFEQQQELMVDWIREMPKPIGLMASGDLLGQQFLEACLRAGTSVPEEIAVIGADNDEPICRIAWPPLSSVIINDHQRGYEAASVLAQMMEGRAPPRQLIQIEPVGVACRASTDVLAIDDALVAAALKFVRDRACEGIDVPDVVKQVPLSRSVLERRFRTLLGRTVNEEIVRVRLNKAVELISSTQLELKVIAYRCGFGSQSYMTAVFRAKLGVTPGSYRKPSET